jgi:hypothetical protein
MTCRTAACLFLCFILVWFGVLVFVECIYLLSLCWLFVVVVVVVVVVVLFFALDLLSLSFIL